MGKVARGGGSGQGRSPALAGGGKGKGKARVNQVVKALSGKTVDSKKAKKKRAPPSWGASGEASCRPRPPPRPAVGGSADGPSADPPVRAGDAAGEAGAAQCKAGEAGPQQDPGQGASARCPAPRGQGGSDDGAAGKRKSHEMTTSDVETVRQVGLLMTPIDTESEDDSAPPPSAPPPPGDSGQWTSTSARLKKRKLLRQQAYRALAQRMDAAAEESAAERGLLIPSLLAQLISDNVKGKPPLKIGSEFTCKAELMLNVAAFNKLHHRTTTRFICSQPSPKSVECILRTSWSPPMQVTNLRGGWRWIEL
jgi:hypothetical protein